MEKRIYGQLQETAYFETLPNGLPVVVVPRPGFSKSLAYFVTDYGSIHTRFTLDAKDHTAPAGVAHFLEHKLFDMPGRDVTAEFAALGAVPNAFTGYDMTAYYFSCTENFYESLSLLLEFVFTPYFTAESVEKEQGIIGQEIDMNEDAPESRIFEDLMGAMYQNHPIREPILGTRQTIAQITPQVLYDCHRAGYRPDNMILCVVADCDPEEIVRIATELTRDMPCPQVTVTDNWEESAGCQQKLVRSQMEVARPMFQLGFKCDPLGHGKEGIYREFVGDLAAEVLFGESSQLYLQLYEEGLIDPSFGGGLDTVPNMALLTATGDSDDPIRVRDAILQRAKQIAE